MSAFRVNSKKAKGHIETSDSHLLQPKEGEGIGDIFSSVSNLFSNHGSKIMTGIEAAGKTGIAAKSLFDAKKSYTDGEELEYIKKKRREKEAKKRLEEEQQIVNQSNKAIQDIVNKALLQQQTQPEGSPVTLRQGNGLKKF